MAVSRRLTWLVFLVFSAASAGWAAPKKKKEERTQVLELPKDPPQAVIGEVSRLVFNVSALSNKGLLSEQVKNALKDLFKKNRGTQIIKIRAFVAGSGDMRRVQTIVSEMFTDKRLEIPAVTVVQVGGLPLVGAQVVLESIGVFKKEVNPGGLAFLSGQSGSAKDAAARLGSALNSAGLAPESLRQVTCYLNSLEHVKDLRPQVAAAFPKVPATFVQLRRDSMGEFAECEGIAALPKPPAKSPSFIGSESGPYPQVALVGPVRIALTGGQLAFGREEADVQLAFDRLGKALESVGASWQTVAGLDTYALIRPLTEMVRKRSMELIDAKNPPATTMLLFEGLPSLDAMLAIDAVAVVQP